MEGQDPHGFAEFGRREKDMTSVCDSKAMAMAKTTAASVGSQGVMRLDKSKVMCINDR